MENSYVFGYVWKVELNDFLLFSYKFSYYNVYSVDNLKKEQKWLKTAYAWWLNITVSQPVQINKKWENSAEINTTAMRYWQETDEIFSIGKVHAKLTWTQCKTLPR